MIRFFNGLVTILVLVLFSSIMLEMFTGKPNYVSRNFFVLVKHMNNSRPATVKNIHDKYIPTSDILPKQ